MQLAGGELGKSGIVQEVGGSIVGHNHSSCMWLFEQLGSAPATAAAAPASAVGCWPLLATVAAAAAQAAAQTNCVFSSD